MIEKIKKHVKIVIASILTLALVLQAFQGVQYVQATEGTIVSAEPAVYTINLAKATRVFIRNEKEVTSGTVVLKYTVESATNTCSQQGLIATTTPAANYPYGTEQQPTGNLKYSNDGFFTKEGMNYEVEMSLADGTVQYAVKRSDGETFTPAASVCKNVNATYFGIWIGEDAGETAVLTNVTCVAKETGEDLGIKVKHGDGGCTLIKNSHEPAEPVSYNVKLTNATKVYIYNKKPTTGKVILKYTAKSRSDVQNCCETGVLATCNPLAENPYNFGQLQYSGRAMTNVDYEYVVRMCLDSGAFKVAGTLLKPEDDATNPSEVKALDTVLVNSNPSTYGGDVDEATYFGLWLDVGTGTAAGPETAEFVNVTCVDENGNDWGVMAKVATGYCEITESGQSSYTVSIEKAADIFIHNATEPLVAGPVTFSYTVKDCSGLCAQTGPLVTTALEPNVGTEEEPIIGYPYQAGWYIPTGRAFSNQLQGQIIVRIWQNETDIQFDGSLLKNTGAVTSYSTVYSNNKDHRTGSGFANATPKYFGIWIADKTGSQLETAEFINVTCMDAAGNDLGVAVTVRKNPEGVKVVKNEVINHGTVYEKFDNSHLLIGPGDLTVNGSASTQTSLDAVGDYNLQWKYFGRKTKQELILYQVGNAHLDEDIDVCDLVAVKKAAEGIDLDTKSAMKGADVTQDEISVVNDADVTMMRKVLVGTATLDEPAAVSYALNDTSVMPIAGYYGPCG